MRRLVLTIAVVLAMLAVPLAAQANDNGAAFIRGSRTFTFPTSGTCIGEDILLTVDYMRLMAGQVNPNHRNFIVLTLMHGKGVGVETGAMYVYKETRLPDPYGYSLLNGQSTNVQVVGEHFIGTGQQTPDYVRHFMYLYITNANGDLILDLYEDSVTCG